jgi:hypothetical protein
MSVTVTEKFPFFASIYQGHQTKHTNLTIYFVYRFLEKDHYIYVSKYYYLVVSFHFAGSSSVLLSDHNIT